MSPAVTVTIIFTATVAELPALMALLEGRATNVSATPAAAGAAAETPPKTRKPRASAAAEAPAPAEVVEDDLFGDDKPAAAATGKVWTLDEVKEEVNKFIQKHSTAAVKAIMADQFKAKRLVEIKPERYAEFVAVLQK